MFMIIACHASGHGIMFAVPQGGSVSVWNSGTVLNKFFACLFRPGCTVGVGIYFMITGYFMINRYSVSVRKIAALVLQCMFYGIFAVIFFVIMRLTGHNFSQMNNITKTIVQYLFAPASSGIWWFITAYIILVLISPFVNKCVSHLNQKGFIMLIAIVWFFLYGLGILGDFYSLYKAVFFYILGGYSRKYCTPPQTINIHNIL